MINLMEIDNEKCVGCGLCTKVCPMGLLEIKNGIPSTESPICMGCGQCIAVCPKEAIDNKFAPLSEQTLRNKSLDITQEQATEFLRSRRSIRWYKNQPVSREDLTKLLNIARYAPTASNSQGVSYLVIEDKDVLEKISKAVIDFMKETLKTTDNPKMTRVMKNMTERYYKSGKDVILLDAPCLIITMAEKNKGYFVRDTAVASILYAQIFAPTIGIGTCWAGLVEMGLTNNYQPLMELLNIPENHIATGAMMAGYPMYEYKRLPERKPLEVIYC